MRGKRAARAAPILALAALSRSSACRMSGRRRSTSDDTPGEIVPERACEDQVVRQQPGRHLRSDQKVQGVFVLSRQSGVNGEIHPRRIHPGLRLAKVQFGRETDVEAPPDQVVGCLLGIEGGSGEPEVFPIRGEGQVRVGDCGYQQDLRAAAGLFGGKVFLQRRVFQAADAAEEVDLPGADPQVDVVLRRRSPHFRRSKDRRARSACFRWPVASTVGKSSARWMPYSARALSTFNAATRRSRLFFKAVSMIDPKPLIGEEFPPSQLGGRGRACADRSLSYAGPLGQEAGTGASGRVYFGASVQPVRRTAVIARSENRIFTIFIAPPEESRRPARDLPSGRFSSFRTIAPPRRRRGG